MSKRKAKPTNILQNTMMGAAMYYGWNPQLSQTQNIEFDLRGRIPRNVYLLNIRIKTDDGDFLQVIRRN